MKRKVFIELTGENPEDVLGNDWENDSEDFIDSDTCEKCLELKQIVL